MNKQTSSLLSQASFSILLALSLKPRHGYELMQQIEQDSGGRVKLGPSTLYGNIKQLRENNLIEEMPFEDNEHRRYYRLTKKGWDALASEVEYYKNVAQLAKKRNIL
jgi:DNA-binding PadR family transcriptional regulator